MVSAPLRIFDPACLHFQPLNNKSYSVIVIICFDCSLGHYLCFMCKCVNVSCWNIKCAKTVEKIKIHKYVKVDENVLVIKDTPPPHFASYEWKTAVDHIIIQT